MEVSGQPYVLASLSPRKQLLLHIDQEAVWAPEPVWMLWNTEESLPFWDLNP